jgi:putative ABC transport system permease protein
MFRNFVLVAFRNIIGNRAYFGLNLVGLSIGLACALLISSYVRYELAFDKFHGKKDRIFRVNYDFSLNPIKQSAVPVFVGPKLKQLFPEIEHAVRMLPSFRPQTLRYANTMYDEKNFFWADSSFFKVFDFEVLYGDANAALSRTGKIALTESMAKKYFGEENAIGKVLTQNNTRELEVVAVLKDVPAQSHFHFDFIASIYNLPDVAKNENQTFWNSPNYITYLLLHPQVNSESLANKINDWLTSFLEGQTNNGSTISLPLQKLTDIHFDMDVSNYSNLISVTDFKYLLVFMAIAVLIVAMACVNYINLATAKSISRSKEVGMRKAVGASIRQLIFQFLAEAALLVLPSILLAATIASLMLPALNSLLDKSISLQLFSFSSLVFFGLLWLALTLLAGFYPAIVLTRFKPALVLKGKSHTIASGQLLRRSLVVIQFSISTVLIVGAIVILSQLDYMQNKSLGFDKSQMVLIQGNADLNDKLESFANQLRGLSQVEQVTRTFRSPFETLAGNGFTLNPKSNDDWQIVALMAGDENVLTTLDVKLLAGRNFDPLKINGDSVTNEFIVNESFLDYFGLSQEEAIGKLAVLGATAQSGPGTIVGVVKDFHYASLQQKIEPLVFSNHPDFFRAVLARIKPGNPTAALDQIKEVWKDMVPSRPFNYAFIDDQYDAFYRFETKTGVLIVTFSALAIMVACLGLLGLTYFTSAQRAKEISIRKVLGASVHNIVIMLSNDYIKLLLISFLISIPLSYYAMSQWLNNFEYRIAITSFQFFSAVALVLLVAMITLSYHSIKSALVNPSEVLKGE